MPDVGDKVLVMPSIGENVAVPLGDVNIGDSVILYPLKDNTKIAVPTLSIWLDDVVFNTPSFQFAGFDWRVDFNFQLIPLLIRPYLDTGTVTNDYQNILSSINCYFSIYATGVNWGGPNCSAIIDGNKDTYYGCNVTNVLSSCSILLGCDIYLNDYYDNVLLECTLQCDAQPFLSGVVYLGFYRKNDPTEYYLTGDYVREKKTYKYSFFINNSNHLIMELFAVSGSSILSSALAKIYEISVYSVLTYIYDESKNWIEDVYAGKYLIILSGLCMGKYSKIIHNTENCIYLEDPSILIGVMLGDKYGISKSI